jgi:hypothetical protein
MVNPNERFMNPRVEKQGLVGSHTKPGGHCFRQKTLFTFSLKRKSSIFVSAKSTYIIVMTFKNPFYLQFYRLSMYMEIRDKPSFYIEDI